MSSDDKQDDTRVAIVDGPFSGDETEQPFGKRWGGECFSYRALAYPDTDFHCASVAPSRAHSFPRRRESSATCPSPAGFPPSRE